MNVNLIGSFVFTNQGYGILSSIYHNTNLPLTSPHPETSKRISDNDPNNFPLDLFDGIYETVWLEPGTEDKTGLEIIKQNDGTYKLRWYDNKKTWYDGIGFLRNDELIGCYCQQ